MSYGLQLKNEFGDNLVDQAKGQTFYKGTSGSTIAHAIIPAAYTSSSAILRDMGPSSGDSLPQSGVIPAEDTTTSSPNWRYNEKIQYAAPRFQSIVIRNSSNTTNRNKRHYVPDPISNNPDDLVFFKLPQEGILNILQFWLPFTGVDINGDSLNTGLTAFCVPDSTYAGGAIDYQVITTTLPTMTSSNTGIKLFDVDGSTILFDTSREIASFVDTIQLSASEAENVILNDASYTFTLRSPVSNAWIASEGAGAGSFRTQIGGSFREETRCLRIQQTSDTEITISRRLMTSPRNASFSGAMYQDYNDALFIIGDFD